MPRTTGEARIIIFAKAPQPGLVKTRLIPVLGAGSAAILHARLVKRTLAMACAAAIGPVDLFCAPGTDDAFFQMCGADYRARLGKQTGNELGTRMLNAFEGALATAPFAILIGTDCPVLTAEHLLEASRKLAAGADAVLAPTEDGGYALIGLRRCDARLFDGVAWGTASVMAETRMRLHALGWQWEELDELWDVDRPEDYRRLLASGLMT